jgi:hypothetical protein
MRACASRWAFRKALVAHLYRLRTVGHQGVLPGRGKAVLGRRLPYLLALHRVRFLAVLSKRIIAHKQNETSYKRKPRHGCSVPLSCWMLLRYCELATRLLVACRTFEIQLRGRPQCEGSNRSYAVSREQGLAFWHRSRVCLWKPKSPLGHSHKKAVRAPSSTAYLARVGPRVLLC